VRFARPAAFVLIAVGLVAGTLGESSSAPSARAAEGYWILAADFHVHGFPGDGALAPWALRREAERAGLDAFALTNHNRTFTGRFGRWLAERSPGAILIPGQEVTATGFHVIAAGIERTVDANQSAAAVIEAVHEQGGVAIAAHPEAPRYTDAYDDRALLLLDGFERAHPVIHERPETRASFVEFDRRARQANPGIAAIGSSDFHANAAIGPGACRTYLLARERSAAGVLDAVREGRTVAADADGNLYGDPRFVTIVEAAGGVIPPPLSTGRWQRVSLWFVWLGLLGLVVFGRRSG
jgi:predicted metal-dependent phosphoesterase TrpH